MSSVVISGDTSGAITLAAPAVAGTTTLTLPATTGNIPVSSYTAYTGGITPNTLMYALNSGLAGSNATGAQSLFGVGVTLSASTIYEFEIVCPMFKTAGTNSHTLGLSFGGTATINNIGYEVIEMDFGSAVNVRGSSGQGATIINTASNTIVTGAMSSATQSIYILAKGTVSINAGGTFIPQYTLSAAPGGAYTTQAGSYMKITPLAASGSNVNIGSWA